MSWWTNLRGTASRILGIGQATLDADAMTAARTHALPDKTGTIAHLSDIPPVLAYMDPATTTTAQLIDALIAGGWMLGPTPAAPANTVAPAITGGTSVGSVLSLSNGSWTGSPTSYAKQWQEDIAGTWTDIAGETGDTYTTDHAGSFRGEVIATNGVGASDPAYSATHTVSSGTLRTFGYDGVPPVEGGFPGQPDRALTSLATKTHAGTVTAIFARFRNTSSAGNAKVCAFSKGAEPGSLIWATPASAVPAGGGLVEFDLPLSGLSGTDAADDYYLVCVVDGYDVDIAKSDSSGLGSSKMANGTFSFASPPATWPGTDANYAGPMSIWCEYLG